MKKTILIPLALLFGFIQINCKDSEVTPSGTKDTLEISFKCGTALSSTSRPEVYVIWAQTSDNSFIQNFAICKRLLDGTLTGTALPYWKTKVYPNSETSEVNAVTGATKKNIDFTFLVALKNSEIRKFKVYFEIDHSYDANDWFDDQPALLYSANIDLDNTISEYEMTPTGWTPNENTQNKIAGTPMGQLQSEMRYITNLKTGSSFGGSDSRSSTNMVGKITVKVR